MNDLVAQLRAWIASRTQRDRDDKNVARGILYVRFSDAGWSAALLDGETELWRESGVCFPESGGSSPSEPLAAAVQALTQRGFADQIASVVLLADDPDLHLVDHRHAKLVNYEPRGLKDFGAQQVGGRQVTFASVPYGASGARELERRILAFLPEQSLESFFYGLGRHATALIAVMPGPVTGLAPPEDGGVAAWLRIHGDYSHLLVANADTGVIVVRRLSFGVFALGRAYGAEQGVDVETAALALSGRNRLPPPASVAADELPPEHRTAGYLALATHLRALRDDIAGTFEFYQFERLAGRPGTLHLAYSGPAIAGLEEWLGEALEMPVVTVAETPVYAGEGELRHPLNLLEGARSGLLRLGSQPYEFAGGRFRPIKSVDTGNAMKTGSGLSAQFATFEKLPGFPLLMRYVGDRQKLMGPVAALGVLVLVYLLNTTFLIGPASAAFDGSSTAYQTSVIRSTTNIARRAAENEDAQNGPQAPLWAEDLVSVAYALVPGLTLKRVALVGDTNAPGGKVLDVTGVVPADSTDYLKTVADYIDGLDDDPSFRRRFGEIFFTGAGSETDGELSFRITARMGTAK